MRVRLRTIARGAPRLLTEGARFILTLLSRLQFVVEVTLVVLSLLVSCVIIVIAKGTGVAE